MNKAEIIRKIAKKSGVPDTEAKKLFEIFLKNISDTLKPGESVKIPGVGLFQLRVGQIENTTEHKEQNFIYSDLIVFINEGESNLTEGEEIIFNVPSGITEEYQPADSHFSLSIGKPIIPLKGVVANEFFIPPSGTELRSLIESKVSRLLEESERVEGGKETETILLKSKGEITDGTSFDWNKLGKGGSSAISEKNEVPSRSDFLKTREFEDLSWDFGENLSEEIEEESILDFEKDRPDDIEIRKDEEKWINEVEEVDEDLDTVPEFEEEISENPDEEIFEDLMEEDTNENIETTDLLEKEISGEIINSDENEESEQISEPEIAKDDESIGTESTEEEETTINKKDSEQEPVLKNFQRVASLTKEFNTSEFDEHYDSETEEHPRRVTEVRGGFQKVRRTTAEFDFDLSGIKGLDEIDETEKSKKRKKSRWSDESKKDYKGYKKNSYLPSYIIGFVVLLALIGILFLYLKLKQANHEMDAKKQAGNNSTQTKVIDRNYDVPVTYPYNSSSDKKLSEKSGNTNDQTGMKENKQQTQGSSLNGTKSNVPEVRAAVDAERVANFIFKYPEGLMVQVSSWKSKSIAIKEVDKYRSSGYSAFAEASTISGKGIYYRVRVGYFNSLNEAKKFANGNQ
jgi:hypothetical protein